MVVVYLSSYHRASVIISLACAVNVAINTRTGLKGYTGKWTDEDLVLYFGITPEEQKIIEKTIDKYK